MAEQDQLWLYLVIGRIDTVFEIVKYVYFPRYRLRRNNLVRLRHVACPVHFPLMVDLQLNLNALVLGNANATLSRGGLA